MKTKKLLPNQLFTLRSPLMRFAALVMIFIYIGNGSIQATDILWSSSGGSAWLTGSNWTGSAVPTATDNAQIGANPTGSGGIGINFSNPTNAGTQSNGLRIEDVGAIELTSARTSGNPVIGNSSGTAGATGTLRLKGTTVNTVTNVILRLNSSQNLTIQNTQGSGTQTMDVSLGNTTENKVVIDGSGTLTISSVIKSDTGTTPLTIMGSGSGRFDVTNTSNTFTGNINITGAEVRFATNGSLGTAANTVTVDGGRLAIVSGTSVDLSARNIFLGATTGTSISAPGASGVLTYNGVLQNKTGSAGILVKQGAGTLSLGGQSTYTGNTAINNGILQLTTGNDRLPTGTIVSIGQTASTNLGTLDLNGRNQQIAGLQSTSGTNATASTNVVTSLTAATLTINNSADYVYSDGSQANSGVISGAITLIKNGNGTQSLGGINTYTGKTTINAGFIAASGESVFGGNPASFTADQITLNGGGIKSTGSMNFSSNRGLTLGANGGTFDTTGGTITLTNVVAGTAGGALTKSGTGSLIMAGAHTYNGATNVQQGTMQLTTGNDRLPTGTVVSVGKASSSNLGTLDLNGFNQQIAGLQSVAGTNATASTNVVTSSTAATLTINNSSDYVYSAGTAANSGVISGAISLVKQGTGKQTLGGANTYSGGTTVSAGTLLVQNTTGSGTGSGAVVVSAGATHGTLGGTGIINATSVDINYDTLNPAVTANKGVLMVGNTDNQGGDASLLKGNLTFAGSTNVTIGGMVQFDLFSRTGTSNNYTNNNNDKLTFSGSGVINFGSTAVIKVNDVFAGGLGSGTGINTLAANDSWQFLDLTAFSGTLNHGAVTFDLPNLSGYEWNKNNFFTNGTLSLQAVPEPSRAVLMLLGAAGFLLRRRRKE